MTLGLRDKTLLALSAAFAVALITAVAVGWQVLAGLQQHFGETFARNATLLSKQRILAPVSRELALSQRLAASEVTRRWLLSPQDPVLSDLFFAEVEGYRRDFADRSYFVISDATGDYYYNDAKGEPSRAPRYRIDRDKPQNAWYEATLAADTDASINVNPDAYLKVTKGWINVIVRDGTRAIGLAGTGLDLTRFLADFVAQREPGVTPMIVNAHGHIQAYPDASMIAYNTGASTESDKTLFRLLAPDDEAAVRTALTAASAAPQTVPIVDVRLDGRPQLLALSYLPELRWYVLTAVDLSAAQVLDLQVLKPVAVVAGISLLVLLSGFAFGTNRLLIRPLLRLKTSAQQIAAGRYDVDLPQARGDEIGDLTQAFGSMAERVRHHTESLETTVAARTAELVEANRRMADAHRKIGDSIDYASLIQRALLPERELPAFFGSDYLTLWKPRDVVGGDFFIARRDDAGMLVGVVDCAGHGVPGAFMTMLAWAALVQAMERCGLRDPATLLAESDRHVRAMIGDAPQGLTLAVNMDAGLVYVDRDSRRAVFAGARMPLFWYAQGNSTLEVQEVRGGRRALADKRPGDYANVELALPPATTLVLTSDGILDQSGGERGYSFGTARFKQMLRSSADLAMSQQGVAWERILSEYRGAHVQRDDITVLAVRV